MTGFIPYRDSNGKPYSGSATRYYVSASDGTALFIGDPVAIEGTNTEAAGKYRSVVKATLSSNNKWAGVVVGVEPVSPELVNTNTPALQNKHRAASTAAYVLVADDPDLEFLIGEDEGGAALVTGDVGNLGIAVAGAGGSTAYGTSSVVLDSSSFTSGTANGQVLLIGMVDRADMGLGGDGQLFRVKINGAMHQLRTPGTTI